MEANYEYTPYFKIFSRYRYDCLQFKESIMNPLLIAAAVPGFVINPPLYLMILGSVSALSLGIAVGLNEEKNKSSNKSSIEKPLNTVKKTTKQLRNIEKKASDTIQKQKITVKLATSTLKHDTQRLDQASAKIERAAKTIETQTEQTQVHIHEISRLRSSVALTNAALKANQKALEKSEVKLSETTHAFLKTQSQLDKNIAAQQKSASKVLEKTVKLHATQTKIIEPLIKSKDVEIAGLKHTLRLINDDVTTALQKEGLFKSQSNLNPNADQNKGVNHAIHK